MDTLVSELTPELTSIYEPSRTLPPAFLHLSTILKLHLHMNRLLFRCLSHRSESLAYKI